MIPKILSTAIAPPPHAYNTQQVLPYLEKWLAPHSKALCQRMTKIVGNAQIKCRRSVVPIEEVFRKTSFEEKNNLYVKHAPQLAARALKAALKKAKLSPDKIDFLITTSCTGFMIPSVDAFLVNALGMRQDILRLPVTEMGCAGGTSGIIYAEPFLRAHPDKYVAIVAVELPTLTLQFDDLSMENIISTAIFADGAACVILGPGKSLGPALRDTSMYHFPNTTSLMGFDLHNSGLKIILQKEIPDVIEANFSQIVHPFLKRNRLTLETINHFIFHPGSIKILNKVENLIRPFGKNLDLAKDVLYQHGNMSSATVLYILDQHFAKPKKKGDWGLMLSVGPGFVAQTILLQWI